MCGIYGTTINYDKKEVETKLKRTDFRGPDYTGVKCFQTDNTKVIFGHNRLAILDLDPRSNQPFTYEDHIHIVFNGEIYNFLELKTELLKKGYSFSTTSDTEVICAAYLAFGEDCTSHFNGMFAFVIYDAKQQLFFGARDRFGQKPFYYYHSGNHFEFASQITSIQLFNENLTISNKSITNYLSWDYIPDPDSIIEEIKKLPAGHSFIYQLDSGYFNEKSYWDIDIAGKNSFNGSYEEAKDKLEILLHDAVGKRMIADVPLGIFLSGGVDSSLVAAMATKNSSNKVKTFSVKFNTKSVDESYYAQQVAAHLQTDHHTIECNYQEGLSMIENFSYYYDEPFADASAIPSLLLAKHTRKHVTVALSGDAADESFLGYHRYNWVRIAEQFYKIPSILRPVIIKTLDTIPYYKSKIIANVLSSKSLSDAYFSMITNTNSTWFDQTKQDLGGSNKKYLFHTKKNIYERISDFDLKTYLNGDINTKVDRASMAYSLEARSPFLDYRVVEFARSLPTEFKFTKNNQKRILKDILYQHVPKNLFDRPKAGFTMPFKEWFRNELKSYVLDELNEEGLKTIPGIHVEQVQKMIMEHMNGKWNRSSIIWKLLVLKQYL